MKKAISILFLLPVICSGQWNQVGNSINGQAAGDAFGYSTAISANGNIIAVGAQLIGGWTENRISCHARHP